jgi:hypothetical protein
VQVQGAVFVHDVPVTLKRWADGPSISQLRGRRIVAAAS